MDGLVRIQPKSNGLAIGSFSLSALGVSVSGRPAFEEWQAAVEFAKRAESGVMWWIGDLLNYGEAHYGETYTQALEATDYSRQTLANAKWVASRFPVSRRRELPFGHHDAVASLDEPEADKLLEQAAEKGWTRAELRSQLRSKGKKEEEDAVKCPRCGFVLK